MNIEELILEITRRCSLDCEHCFRGESQNVDINDETIINIFKDVKLVDKLVLTGGEPFLVPSAIDLIAQMIKKHSIIVNQILIITNGTILNNSIKNALNKLSRLSKLNIRISYDAFHESELERKNLKKTRDDNTQELIKLFNAKEYGAKDNLTQNKVATLIKPIGRANNISETRKNELESKYNLKYFISDIGLFEKNGHFENGKLSITSIDVYGNIVKYESSFIGEDEYAKTSNTNINELGLYIAISNHIRNIGEDWEIDTLKEYEKENRQRKRRAEHQKN